MKDFVLFILVGLVVSVSQSAIINNKTSLSDFNPCDLLITLLSMMALASPQTQFPLHFLMKNNNNAFTKSTIAFIILEETNKLYYLTCELHFTFLFFFI